MATHGASQQQEAYIYESFLQAYQTCTAPWVLGYSNPLPGVPIKLQELMVILAAIAMIINTILAMYLIWGHCFHWTKPMEQKQIIRILVFIPFLSACCLSSIWSYPASGFITPAGDYYEGFAITALFMLYVQLATRTADDSQREEFFNSLERRWVSGKKKGSGGSLRWFRVLWALVFQITIVRIGTVAANETLWSVTCPLNLARKYGFIVITVIQGVSVGVGVTACVVFERRMQTHLAGTRSAFKLWSFKIVVGLSAAQDIIFSVLAQNAVFFPLPPYHVSYHDFSVGLPNVILIWELTIVAFMFLRSFEFQPYLQDTRNGAPVYASAGRALLQSFNTSDIFYGLAYSFTGWHKHTGPLTDAELVPLDKGESPSYHANGMAKDGRYDTEAAM